MQTVTKSTAKVSVLMSIYWKEKSSNLTDCFDSIYNQIIMPDEIVLVFDGPINDDLEQIISNYKSLLNIVEVRLQHNIGLGYALSQGIYHCRHDLIMRMDTDDIMLPNRVMVQYDFMTSHPQIDVSGCFFKEFIGSVNFITSTANHYGLTHNEISHKLKYRSPFAHATIIAKKQAILNAGNYNSKYIQEDYYLFVRMYLNGAKFANIPEYLLHVRVDAMLSRRVGFNYLMSEFKLFKFMYDKNVINLMQYGYNLFIRVVVRVLLPSAIVSMFYNKFLRGKSKKY